MTIPNLRSLDPGTRRLLDPTIYKHSRHSHHRWPLVVLVVAVAVLLVASDFSNNKNCSLSSARGGWLPCFPFQFRNFLLGGHVIMTTKTWTEKTSNNTTIVWVKPSKWPYLVGGFDQSLQNIQIVKSDHLSLGNQGAKVTNKSLELPPASIQLHQVSSSPKKHLAIQWSL